MTIYNLLRVTFVSEDDWQPHTDILRCNSNVHGVDRSDCVMVNTEDGICYARLHLMFTCQAFGQEWKVALVTYFDEVKSAKKAPCGIGMSQVKESSTGDFIIVESIIRGAYLSPDAQNEGYFFVNDLIDGDIFLRIQPS